MLRRIRTRRTQTPFRIPSPVKARVFGEHRSSPSRYFIPMERPHKRDRALQCARGLSCGVRSPR
eukprot:scaffold926_cov248-Pinguiococcus_pyrenoidosus.AAC.29